MNSFENPEHNPSQHENVEQNEQILHDVEVVARTLDMVPARSDLGQYLASPATEIVKDADGHSRAIDAKYSNIDKIKSETEIALQDYAQGKVGRVKILSGMVNGYIDAHQGSKTKNMRWAFEQLSHFNITGSADFHSLLNRSGQIAGKLDFAKPDSPEEETNNRVLAQGAARIRDGHRAVMFNNYKDEPDTKMYGMRDPETGELLQNTFMLVKSGTFTDKDGTTSNFSNLAFAEVVMVPEDLIVKTSEPTAETTPEAVEPSFDIDAVDWDKLKDGHFKVRRTGGAIDEGGWQIRQVTDKNGQYVAEITSWDKQRGQITKIVPIERLLSWQEEE